MLRVLSAAYGATGGSAAVRRIVTSPPASWLVQTWLHRTAEQRQRTATDDVTVVIGVRNRSDYRLANALRSIREQAPTAGGVHALVVDYGSTPEHARRTREHCQRQQAECVRIADAPVWSRSRALNVGIRRAATTFVMTSDADIVFSSRYLADAVRALRQSPTSIVCSTMWDLPEGSSGDFRQVADQHAPLLLEPWHASCSPRSGLQLHPSIAVTYAAYYRLIRGYDEYYQVWGCEDDDLMRRFQYLGLRPRLLDSASFYLHQWHPKYEGVAGDQSADQIEKNRTHLGRSHSILRNDDNWGTAIAEP